MLRKLPDTIADPDDPPRLMAEASREIWSDPHPEHPLRGSEDIVVECFGASVQLLLRNRLFSGSAGITPR